MADANDKSSSTALPLLVGGGLLLLSLVIALITGITKGTILGAVIAAFAAIPGAYTAWVGIQNRESQSTLLYGILLVVGASAFSTIFVLLRFVNWLT